MARNYKLTAEDLAGRFVAVLQTQPKAVDERSVPVQSALGWPAMPVPRRDQLIAEVAERIEVGGEEVDRAREVPSRRAVEKLAARERAAVAAERALDARKAELSELAGELQRLHADLAEGVAAAEARQKFDATGAKLAALAGKKD